MRYPSLTPDLCARLAREEFATPGCATKLNKTLDKEITQSLIGTSYNVCAELWNLIDPLNSNNAKLRKAHPKHLFWSLCFLTACCTEPVLRRLVGGVDDGTLRSWVWLFNREIAGLKPRVIIFKNRFRNWNGRSICLISVDGTDCAMMEPCPFNEGTFSVKLNGPGCKYEIGVCIATGDIVWVNGPFKAGRNDVTMFKEDGLRDALCEDECVEADGGYQGDDKLKNKNIARSEDDKKEKEEVRARHEIVNSRLKQFGVLDQIFRHNVDREEKHKTCFEAVAVITQLGFELDGGLHSVRHNTQHE